MVRSDLQPTMAEKHLVRSSTEKVSSTVTHDYTVLNIAKKHHEVPTSICVTAALNDSVRISGQRAVILISSAEACGENQIIDNIYGDNYLLQRCTKRILELTNF